MRLTSLHQSHAAGLVVIFPRQFTTQRRPNQTQRSHPRHMHHPQAHCGFRCRSWTGGTFLECTRRESFSTNPCQTWPSTTPHRNTHQQHNNSQYCQQHHQTPMIKIYGNEVFLVIRWWNATILQILLPTWPWKPWWLSIQTSYCWHTSTRPTLLCPHGQFSHSATTSYEAKHSSRVCWNPRGSLLQEAPITKHGHFPLSGHLPYRYQLPSTWPVKNTIEKYHSLQPSKNTCTIETHNSREHLLALYLLLRSLDNNYLGHIVFCLG